jgi:hypothetical protein
MDPMTIEQKRVRPIVADVSTDRDRMLKLAQRCRRTKRFLRVATEKRDMRVAPLRFPVWFVLCWPKPEPAAEGDA